MFAKKWLFSSDTAIATSAVIAFKISVTKSSQTSCINHKTACR